jgi:hypothetical protein
MTIMERTFVYGGDPTEGEISYIGASIITNSCKPSLRQLKDVLEETYGVRVNAIRVVTELLRNDTIKEDLYW